MGIGVGSGLGSLTMLEEEFEAIFDFYSDQNDREMVLWRKFAEDIEQVFRKTGLYKHPEEETPLDPPSEVINASRKGIRWDKTSEDTKDIGEKALKRVKNKLERQRIFILPFFKSYDTTCRGLVARQYFRQILASNGFNLSGAEYWALEKRFCGYDGFNYVQFLQETKAEPMDRNAPEDAIAEKKIITLKGQDEIHTQPPEIKHILHKIKREVASSRVRVLDFFKQYDRHNKQVITRVEFERALVICNLYLSAEELKVLAETFTVPFHKAYVDYKWFTDIIEVFTQPDLERKPLIIPMPYITTHDGPHNFLNINDRKRLQNALQKLSKITTGGDLDIFQDFDVTNGGLVSKVKFTRALSQMSAFKVLKQAEVDVIIKGFSRMKGRFPEVDYRAFVNMLDQLCQGKG